MSRKKTGADAGESFFPASMPQIEELSVDAIHPSEENPRFNADAVEPVMNSIRDFGWQQPIVVADDGEIVAGHTRYAAAIRLGLRHVPCVRASNLTPEQVRAYRLVDNKTNEIASWDDVKLDDILAELPQFDFSQYGFDSEHDEDVAGAFGDDPDEGDDEKYADADKISLKIPIEHIDQVREWLRDGGKEKAIDWILFQAGCTNAGDDDGQEADDAEEVQPLGEDGADLR